MCVGCEALVPTSEQRLPRVAEAVEREDSRPAKVDSRLTKRAETQRKQGESPEDVEHCRQVTRTGDRHAPEDHPRDSMIVTPSIITSEFPVSKKLRAPDRERDPSDRQQGPDYRGITISVGLQPPKFLALNRELAQ